MLSGLWIQEKRAVHQIKVTSRQGRLSRVGSYKAEQGAHTTQQEPIALAWLTAALGSPLQPLRTFTKGIETTDNLAPRSVWPG